MFGIFVSNGAPVIEKNEVGDNIADSSGPTADAAGIFVMNLEHVEEPVRICNNIIRRNLGNCEGMVCWAGGLSMGIVMQGEKVEIINNIITGYYPPTMEGLTAGAGIMMVDFASASILHNTVSDNYAGVSLSKYEGGSAAVINNIISANTIAGLFSDDSGTLTADYNNVLRNR